MPLRLRILPAAREVRAIWVAAGGTGLAEGPSDERQFEVAGDLDELRIGRQPQLEIELPFPAVSSVHARLFRGELASDWRVEDLGSMNGSWLDGQRLVPGRPVPVRAGQRLRFATVDMIFEGWSLTARDGQVPEGTATIARRLISDLFGVVGGEVARLTVEAGGAGNHELRLSACDRRYLVGRAESCDLVLAGEHVSREHAAFVRRADGVVLHDLGSKNGLMVNGRSVTGERRLSDGDRITIGTASVRLTDPEERYLRRLEAVAGPTVAASSDGPSSPLPSPAPPSGPPAPAGPSPHHRSGVPSSIRQPVLAPRAAGGVVDSSLVARDGKLPRAGGAFGRAWGTALVATIAVLAIAGLVALWLTTR